MAIPVARVHLKVAHAALPALLPTPPKWKKLPLLRTPCVAAAILPKPPLAKPPSRADSDERWDAHKTKSSASSTESSSSSSSPRSTSTGSTVKSCAAGRGSFCKNATTSPPPKPGRADSVERWDAHKKSASPASSSSSSSPSPGTISLVSSSKCPIISRPATTSTERWDVHKERRPPQANQRLDDDGESSSTGSNDIDIDIDTEEEILWKPRAMYAGPGFAGAAPEPSVLPTPTALFVRVA